MATLKTQANDGDVQAFLQKVENPQKKADSFRILEMMENITGEPPQMWGDSIIGFGRRKYKYASGREGEWFQVGFSPRKQSISLYIMSDFSRYADTLAKLGKHKTGKGCLYVNRLSDIDETALQDLIQQAVDHIRSEPST